MSWYKIAQINILEPEETQKRDLTYTDIGHSIFTGYDKENELPNFMWIFYQGQLQIREETPENPTHIDYKEWADLPYGDFACGRYESDAKTISIVSPNGIQKFRPIPKFLIQKLLRQFPDAKHIYRFANANFSIKTAQFNPVVPIRIVSYEPSYGGKLEISFRGGRNYKYPNVSPYLYNYIASLLSHRNYKSVEKILRNISPLKEKDYTEEEKTQMLEELYKGGLLR